MHNYVLLILDTCLYYDCIAKLQHSNFLHLYINAKPVVVSDFSWNAIAYQSNGECYEGIVHHLRPCYETVSLAPG